MNKNHIENSGGEYWLDKPKNILAIIVILIVLCVILFFFDAFYHKHVYFEIENLFGFYGVYGFFVCVGLVLIAKSLRTVLMRSEDYYENSDEDHQTHE